MHKLQFAACVMLAASCGSKAESPAGGGGEPAAADGGGASDRTSPGGGGEGGAGAGVSGRGDASHTGGAGGASGGGGASGNAGSSAGANPAADGGSGGSSSSAECPGLFCEDFETGTLDTTVWTRTQLTSGNSALVASDKAAHGKYAMHFFAKGGSRYSMILHDGLPDALGAHYFGRLYFFITGVPTESGGHTAFITSSNTLAGFPDQDHHLEVASYYEKSMPTWQMTYWTGDGPEYIANAGMIPTNKWFCLEWEFDDQPDAITIWVDGDAKQGASFKSINNGESGLLGKMTTLGLGFRTWHPTGAPDVDVYIDDVVLDTQRIGCL